MVTKYQWILMEYPTICQLQVPLHGYLMVMIQLI